MLRSTIGFVVYSLIIDRFSKRQRNIATTLRHIKCGNKN